MTVTQKSGTFSLTFSVAGDHKMHAVDWNHTIHGEWSHSRRAGVGWECLGLIGKRERLVLISLFGLEKIADQLPLETIRQTGPKKLITMRRRLEAERGLERLEVRSDTLGYNALADDHPE